MIFSQLNYTFLKNIPIVIVVLAASLFRENIASSNELLPVSSKTNQSGSTGKVTFAHVSLMHPHFDKPDYPMGEFSGKPLDTEQFEDQIKKSYIPDSKYQGLWTLVSSLFKHNFDVVSIAGVSSQEIAKHLIYYFYIETLSHQIVHVAGFDVNHRQECDLCRHINYSEFTQSLILSRYPLRDKVLQCHSYYSYKHSGKRGLGCFLGNRVAFGETSFSFITVNVAELSVIQEAQQLRKEKRLWSTLKKVDKSVLKDYLVSVRDVFRPTSTPGLLPFTLYNEEVVFSGFWAMGANNFFDAPLLDKSITDLHQTLATKILPIKSGTTSLEIMSNPVTRQYFIDHGILLPQSDSLVDFIGFSTIHGLPVSMSELSSIKPEYTELWLGHRIVYRAIELSKKGKIARYYL